MNATIRRIFQQTPILRDVYRAARAKRNSRRFARAAEKYFVNVDEYEKTLGIQDGQVVDLQMKNGLTVSLRRNGMDASILTEVFVDNCYTQDVVLRDRPIVVDIGGYIGDSALYAVKCLNAARVIVFEPSPRNWTLLQKNVMQNSYETRIEMVNKAVTAGQDVMLDVDVADRGQAMVSAYSSSTGLERKVISGISLASIVQDYGLDVIDLLKIDCEGGEYDILLTTSSDVLRRARNIVFEFHEIEGFKPKLAAIKKRLQDEGYSLKTRGSLISASIR